MCDILMKIISHTAHNITPSDFNIYFNWIPATQLSRYAMYLTTICGYLDICKSFIFVL